MTLKRNLVVLAILAMCLACVVLFGAFFVYPALHTRSVVQKRYAAAVGGEQAVMLLGGRKAAARRIRQYISLPAWAVPRKVVATQILEHCTPFAGDALDVAFADSDWSVRRAALRVAIVASYRAPAGTLRGLLGDGRSEVRADAARLAAWQGEASLIPGLMLLLDDEAMTVRGASCWALGCLGSREAVPRLLKALEDESGHVRVDAAMALSKLGHPKHVEAFRGLMKHPDSAVRAYCIGNLGELRSPRYARDFLLALEDRDKKVRSAAFEAVRKLKAKHVSSGLKALLCRSDAPEDSRGDAARLLGRLRVRDAIRILGRVLADRQERRVVRVCAAMGLGYFDSPAALSCLQAAAKCRNHWVCRIASEEIARMNARKSRTGREP